MIATHKQILPGPKSRSQIRSETFDDHGDVGVVTETQDVSAVGVAHTSSVQLNSDHLRTRIALKLSISPTHQGNEDTRRISWSILVSGGKDNAQPEASQAGDAQRVAESTGGVGDTTRADR